MLLEVVILLSIANIVMMVLIMKQLGNTGFSITETTKKPQIKEKPKIDDDDPEPKPEPEKIKKSRFNIAEKLHLKKQVKQKKHVSEMPDLERVRQELEEEFKKGSKPKNKSKKKKNEIAERLEEIEKS